MPDEDETDKALKEALKGGIEGTDGATTAPKSGIQIAPTHGDCSVLLLRPRPPIEIGWPPPSLPVLDRDLGSVPSAGATSLLNGELGHHGAQLFGRAEAPPLIL